MTKNTPANTNGTNVFSPTTNTMTTGTTQPQMAFKSPEAMKIKDISKPTENGTSPSLTQLSTEKSDSKDTEYYANLKGLNESVSNWIKTHVDKNPFCILTPIFKDYEKYLSEIESKKDKPVNTIPTNLSPFKNTQVTQAPTISTTQTPSFPSQTTPKTVETNIFSSSSTTKISEEKSPFATKPTLNFGSSSSSLGSTTGFSFGTGAPFTFTNVAKPPAEEKKEEENGEEDEPPKVEFTPVVEEDHIFTKRCKVFVKKDGNFGDRGVGQLFLKPVAGSEKVQLIVRADTNLGNLLLNFILSESIPLQRMGKNNVMLVCIPTPDTKPPPVPVLLRVKTTEEADELLKILEKNKK